MPPANSEEKSKDSPLLARLWSLHQQSSIQIVPEPNRWSYPDPYRPDHAGNTLYAIYAPPHTLEELQKISADCLTSRPRCSVDSYTKAYLKADVAKAFVSKLAAKENSVALEPTLSALALFPNKADVTLGVYHTSQSEADAPSYLVVGTKDANSLNQMKTRLAYEGQSREVSSGEQAGKLLVIPVWRSVADAITRAHPQTIDLSDNVVPPIASSASIRDASYQLMAVAEARPDFRRTDERIDSVDIAPKTTPTKQPDRLEERATVESCLDILLAHHPRFHRTEQFGGGVTTEIVLDANDQVKMALHTLAAEKFGNSDRRIMIHREGIRHTGANITLRINEATYEAIHQHAQKAGISVSEQSFQQSFSSNWLNERKIQNSKHKIFHERIRSARLVSWVDGEEQKYGLVAEARSLRRNELLAQDLGIKWANFSERMIPFTRPEETPALSLITMNATMAQNILREAEEAALSGAEYPVEILEKPAESIKILEQTIRDETAIRGLPSTSSAPDDELPAPPKTKRTEETIRVEAEKILFAPEEENGIHAIAWASARFGKTKDGTEKPAQPCMVLKIDGLKDDLLRKKLRACGFAINQFHHVGESGHYSLYFIPLSYDTAKIWEARMQAGSMLRPSGSGGEEFPDRYALIDAVKTHFKETESPQNKVQEAWHHLKDLAETDKIRYVDILYTAEDMRQERKAYDTRIRNLRSAARRLQASVKNTQYAWNTRSPDFFDHSLDTGTQNLSTGLDTLSEVLSGLRAEILTAEGERKRFDTLIKQSPAQPDQSRILQQLIVPDPTEPTLRHLWNLHAVRYKRPEADKKDPGIPIFNRQRKKIKAGGCILHAIPIAPEFFDEFSAHGGSINKLYPEPIPFHEAKEKLKGTYYRVSKLVPPKLVIADVDQEKSAQEKRETEARVAKKEAAFDRLWKRNYLENAKGNLLFCHLHPEIPAHENEDPLPPLAHERMRLGTQPALMLQMNSLRDKNKINQLIDALHDANMLAPAGRYTGDTEQANVGSDVEETHTAKKAVTAAIEAIDTCKLPELIADKGMHPTFRLIRLRNEAEKIQTAMENTYAPREVKLHALIGGLSRSTKLPEEAMLEELQNRLEQYRAMLLQNRQELAAETVERFQEWGKRSQQRSIAQDEEVRFFTDVNAAGVTKEALDTVMDEHFRKGDKSSPFRLVVHLSEPTTNQERRVIDFLAKHCKMPDSIRINKSASNEISSAAWRSRIRPEGGETEMAQLSDVTLPRWFEVADASYQSKTAR